MAQERRFVATVVVIGLVAFGHALLTWPPHATLGFFGGGALVAFLAEAVVIRLGWLEHTIGPKVAGVPLYVLLGWVGTIYAAFRLGLVVTDGWLAVGLAAVLATTYDLLSDHRGVADGYWRYTDDLPGPRVRGVPWWNFAGWVAISTATAAVAVPFL